MVETELKFQVPDASRKALQRAVATPAAVTTRLRARYHDTPDRCLAAAGFALRLRQEGRVWVQALKGPRSGLAGRLEHEVRLPPGRGVPSVDLSRHGGTPAADGLRAALGADAAALELVFETDVRRTHRVLRVAGAQIELALDIGTLLAAGRRQPIWELEFELKSGPVDALYALATRWVQRHGLWLDARTKAERGDLLSRGLAVQAPIGAQVPSLHPSMSLDQALRAMVKAALAQALPNAAALAGGVGQAEHLHQLRVGLRRLRSVLKLVARPQGGPSVEQAEQAEQAEELAALFRRLGGTRDRDVLASVLLPALAAAGAPPIELPPAALHEDVAAVLREPPVVTLLLALMATAEDRAPGDAGEQDQGPPIAAMVRRRLTRLDRRLAREAQDFRALDDEQRHRLRRQIKRLRYGVEATQALWPARSCKRYLAGLAPMQDALGTYNDLQMAGAWLAQSSASDDATWFARGWLAAQREPLVEAAAAALQHWPKVPKAWRAR